MATISQMNFQIHFLEWKLLYFNSNFTEVCSQKSNWQYASIGSDNGMAPNRRQAIIWDNAVPIHWRIYAALGGEELTAVAHINNLHIKCIRVTRPNAHHHYLCVRFIVISDGACCPGGHCCDYHEGALSLIKSLQPIWRSGTCRFPLLVPGFQISNSDFKRVSVAWHGWKGNKLIVPVVVTSMTYLLVYTPKIMTWIFAMLTAFLEKIYRVKMVLHSAVPF